MKHFIPLLSFVVIFSCDVSTKDNSSAYVAELKIKKINFYGDTIRFDPPQVVTITPNTDEIVPIRLGNGSEFGVRYFVSEMSTGSDQKLMHNAAFFEKVNGNWSNLNSLDHREVLNLNEEKDWGIGVGDNGEQYFTIDFSYKVTRL